jgi:hypothetical protein
VGVGAARMGFQVGTEMSWGWGCGLGVWRRVGDGAGIRLWLKVGLGEGTRGVGAGAGS